MTYLHSKSTSTDIAMHIYGGNNNCPPNADADPNGTFYDPSTIRFPFNAITPSQPSKAVREQGPAPRASLPFFSLSGWLTVFFVAFVAMAAAASELSAVAQMMVNGGTR